MKPRNFIYLMAVLALIPTSLGAQQITYDRFPSQLQVERLNGTLPGAARGNGAVRKINELSLDFIKLWEGWSSKAYDDPAGYCTIGFGHLIKKDLCRNVDNELVFASFDISEGNMLLEKDTLPARLAVEKLVTVRLDDNQFGALTSFVFNVGAANFSRSTLLKLLNLQEYDLASAQLSLWVKAGGKTLRGLRNRRACEIELFHGRLKRTSTGAINIDACQALAASPNAASLIDIETGE